MITLPKTIDPYSSKIRIESSKQNSGYIALSRINLLKEKHYYVIDVTLDGDAPKQYIKAYFYYDNCPWVSEPRTWDGYYSKFGGKSYPHESIVEYCVNKIGEAIGLHMNSTRLVVANSQVRFLSKDFITTGKRLIHGIEILAEYFEDKEFVEQINQDKKTRRELLTFEEVENAIRHVYPEFQANLLDALIDLITFDALVGNNDRHFYNWGVIGDIEKKVDQKVTFAPIYDSARALLWNFTEDRICSMFEDMKRGIPVMEKHMMRSFPRFSCGEYPNANHFELIRHLAQRSENYRSRIHQLSTIKSEKSAVSCLHKEAAHLFSEPRIKLMEHLLRSRFRKVRENIE